MGDESQQNAATDESWVAVEGAANQVEAELVAGFLRAHDIPARVVDRSFHQTPTSDEDLSPIAVAVPASRVADAEAALAARDSAFDKSSEGSEAVLTDEGLSEIDTNTDDEGSKGSR